MKTKHRHKQKLKTKAKTKRKTKHLANRMHGTFTITCTGYDFILGSAEYTDVSGFPPALGGHSSSTTTPVATAAAFFSSYGNIASFAQPSYSISVTATGNILALLARTYPNIPSNFKRLQMYTAVATPANFQGSEVNSGTSTTTFLGGARYRDETTSYSTVISCSGSYV